jgi:hypothetical protein
MSQFNARCPQWFQSAAETKKEPGMEHGENRAAPLFIVVLDEVLVARDIELIIRDTHADTKVIVARSLDALKDLPDGQIGAAFVQAEADQVAKSEIYKRVQGDGGRIILVGHDSDQGADDFLVLPLPFVQANVAALLAKILSKQGPSGGP